MCPTTIQEGGTEVSSDSTGSKAGGQEDKNCAARQVLHTGVSALPGTKETRKTLVELTCGKWNDMALSLPASMKEVGSANILNTVQESKRKGKH